MNPTGPSLDIFGTRSATTIGTGSSLTKRTPRLCAASSATSGRIMPKRSSVTTRRALRFSGREDFISSYATTHPWEDWAETWAHYLHMADALETAASIGLSLAPRGANEPSLELSGHQAGVV